MSMCHRDHYIPTRKEIWGILFYPYKKIAKIFSTTITVIADA